MSAASNATSIVTKGIRPYAHCQRGQPAEFEADGEIERRFRENLAEARQTIDDVLPAGSEQKQEALEAVKEFEEDVAATDGDEEALQEGKDPGAYADTLTLRFDLKTGLISTDLPTDAELRLRDPTKKPYKEMPELVVGVIHQRVFEAFWSEGETFPSRR